MTLQLALADDPEGRTLAKRFAALAPAGAAPARVAHETPGADERLLEAVRRSVAERRKLEILYAGSGDRRGRRRVVRPHELLVHGGRFYCVAWCELVTGWRHFRLDRMLDARLLDAQFTPDGDYEPAGVVFRAEEPDRVRVRFGPAIARWLRERYPEGEPGEGGAWEVELDVADPNWLVRHVLYFGAEAEVVAPEEYREAVARAVGAG